MDSSTPLPPRYQVTFQALPDADAPAAVRLKRLLKAALRTFRFRVVDAREVAGDTPAGAPGIVQNAAGGAGRDAGTWPRPTSVR